MYRQFWFRKVFFFFWRWVKKMKTEKKKLIVHLLHCFFFWRHTHTHSIWRITVNDNAAHTFEKLFTSQQYIHFKKTVTTHTSKCTTNKKYKWTSTEIIHDMQHALFSFYFNEVFHFCCCCCCVCVFFLKNEKKKRWKCESGDWKCRFDSHVGNGHVVLPNWIELEAWFKSS